MINDFLTYFPFNSVAEACLRLIWRSPCSLETYVMHFRAIHIHASEIYTTLFWTNKFACGTYACVFGPHTCAPGQHTCDIAPYTSVSDTYAFFSGPVTCFGTYNSEAFRRPSRETLHDLSARHYMTFLRDLT